MLSVLKQTAYLLFSVFFIWAAGFAWFVSTIPTSGTLDEARTDAIVVLTGGGLRLEHGLSLLITGKAPVLFVSGVESGVTLPELLRSKGISQIAQQVPHDKVELGYVARSTLQNAEETKSWVMQHNVKSIRLVTGNYHMPRSVFLMHEALPDVAIVADPVFPAEFSNNTWWLSSYGLRLVISEYHKYIASAVAVMLGIISDE